MFNTMPKPIGGSGGGSFEVTITPTSKITSNMNGEGGGVYIGGTLTVANTIHQNDIVFTVSPPPKTAQNISAAFQFSSTQTRDVSIDTSGNVIMTSASNMDAGYTWNVSISYPIN